MVAPVHRGAQGRAAAASGRFGLLADEGEEEEEEGEEEAWEGEGEEEEEGGFLPAEAAAAAAAGGVPGGRFQPSAEALQTWARVIADPNGNLRDIVAK